jgi:hypothetical protein
VSNVTIADPARRVRLAALTLGVFDGIRRVGIKAPE